MIRPHHGRRRLLAALTTLMMAALGLFVVAQPAYALGTDSGFCCKWVNGNQTAEATFVNGQNDEDWVQLQLDWAQDSPCMEMRGAGNHGVSFGDTGAIDSGSGGGGSW